MVGEENEQGHYAMVYAPMHDLKNTYVTDATPEKEAMTLLTALSEYSPDDDPQLAFEFVLDEAMPDLNLRFPRHEDTLGLRSMMRQWTVQPMDDGFDMRTWTVPEAYCVVCIIPICLASVSAMSCNRVY